MPKKRDPLSAYFSSETREISIANAIEGGYKQNEIAQFLNLSNVSISKIYKNYRQKVILFNKLRDKGGLLELQ